MEDEAVDQKASLRSVYNFTTREHTVALTISVLLAAAVGIIKPAVAIFSGKVFNDLTNFGAGNSNATDLLSGVSKWCLVITVFGVISWILNAIFFSMWLGFGEMQAKSAREKLFASMLKKEMSWYDLRSEGIGALLSRIATQVHDLQISASQPFGFILGDLGTACAALGIALYSSWRITLVTLAGFPVAVIILGLIAKQMTANIEAQKRDLTQAAKSVNTALISIDTVKAYNGQEQEVWQYAAAVKRAARSYLKQANIAALQMGITRFVITGMFVQGFWYGSSLVDKGLSTSALLTTFYACLQATQSAETLLPQWLVIARGMSAGATLKNLLLQMRDGRRVVEMGGSGKPATCFGDIEITDLSFAYPSNPKQLALEKTNFFFPAGETTFVIGRSGSGKSTLSNLLLKFYEPASGNLSIDGESLQTLDVTWLRQNITLVQQQSILFDGSMFQNIALGSLRPDSVTKEEALAACEACMLRAVIDDLPEGLDTNMGAGAMSGGQKQRVALARARLRDTPILILDEATSALDQISRSLVMDAVREWRKGKTTIIITHDISQVLANDYVYVLDKGKLVQEGYRRILAQETGGLFASFVPVGGDVQEESGLGDPAVNDDRLSLSGSFSSDSSDGASKRRPNFRRTISKRISTILGFEGEKAFIDNRGPSYGMKSAYANVVLAEENVIRRDEEALVSRPQVHSWSPHQRFSYSDPSWAGSFAQYRPSSSTARTLGLRPQSAVLTPLARNSASVDSHQDAEPDVWRLPSMIPSGLKNETMRRTGSFSTDSRSLSDVRRSGGIRSPVDDIGRMLGPRKFAHRIDDVKADKSKAQKGTKNKKEAASLTQILGTVWPTLDRQDKFILIGGFVFAFIHAAATPIFSFVLAELIQTFYKTTNRAADARKWSLAILAIAIVDGLATYFMHYLLEHCGQAWVNTLRVRALERILNQPRSWFDKEKNDVGRLNECLDRNAEEMRNLVGRFAGLVFVAVSMMAIAVIWSLAVSWKLTLVGLSSAPIMWGVTRAFEYTSGKWEAKGNESAESAHRIFEEAFANIRIVRAFTLETYFQDKYSAAILKTFKIGVKRATYTGMFFGLSDSATLFVTALIFYYSAVLAAHGSLSVTGLFTVVNLLLFGIGTANAMMGFIPQISQSRITATHLLHLANLSDGASHESLGKMRTLTPLPIKLNSVSFTYPSRPTVQVLHNVSITFTPGSCTAIVGASGSGKSTIASLLLNLYPATPPSLLRGHSTTPPLTFANVPLTSLHTPTLRSHIGIVPQTAVLFPTSILKNITYGLQSTSPFNNEGCVVQAARDADIHDFIQSLPNGYQTIIGDGGQGLSGGQAQRIVIARALIRRPKVLILDEATSALDGESADMIRATISRLISKSQQKSSSSSAGQRSVAFDGLRSNSFIFGRRIEGQKEKGGMAVIVITHSVEMMRVAERLVVLEAGKVVEVGTWEELVRRRGGAFARLVEGVEYRRDLDTVVELPTPTSPRETF